MFGICLTLMSAISMSIVSDRRGFEDADHISNYTHQKTIELSSLAEKPLSLHQMVKDAVDKDVLILLHGYNNDYKKALESYQIYYQHTQESYQKHIGYLWPGGDEGHEYHPARNRVVYELDLRLLGFLTQIHAVAKSVDIYAHSMGCRLALETLDLATGKLIRNLFLTAAAIQNESIQIGERYHKATQNCEHVFVFHSRNDRVLRWLFRGAEFDRALGYKGPEDPDRVPSNVSVIDLTDTVDSHGGYKEAPFTVFEKMNGILSSSLARVD